MDPLTQGVVGTVFAQTRSRNADLAKAALIGAIAGMAPDLDVLIRSSTDPLLVLQYHRQFTHSLIMAPLLGWLCSLLLYPLLGNRWRLSYQYVLFWCIIGVASHGLLDACTTYGTQLFWPLTDYRVSWDIISVVDPLFTVPLLIFVACAAFGKRGRYVVWAMLWGSVYLLLGFAQHERAEAIGYRLAQERGHHVLRLEAKPSFANIVVWKIVYETDTAFYVDAVKPGLLEPTIWPGEHVEKLAAKRDLPWLDTDSQQSLDITRFRTFSDNFVALDPNNGHRIADIRYSMLPNTIAPLWGIELSPNAAVNEHAAFYTTRGEASAAVRRLLQMIIE